MNKKEIQEIKKQFSLERRCLTRICGCFVDGEKEIRMQMREAFPSLPEEETFKYFKIFQKSLSGHPGRELLDFEFPLDAEEPGSPWESLLKLRDSGLKDDEVLGEFYQRVIRNYRCPDGYYIVLVHGRYDIPGKGADGTELFDASDEVYDFLLCSLCPMKLSKPGLAYRREANRIENRVLEWVVEEPAHGFLFPAFNGRQADIHGMLYYTRKAEDPQREFIQEVSGILPRSLMTAREQREALGTLIAGVAGHADYETVSAIHACLMERMEEAADSPEPVILTRRDVADIFEESGIPEERLEGFAALYEAVAGNKGLQADNLIGSRQISIKTAHAEVKVDAERMDLVESRVIDGRQCLVITVDGGAELNGIPVRMAPQEG